MKKLLTMLMTMMLLSAIALAEPVTVTGTGHGIDGDVVVEVTVDDTTIYSVRVTAHNETQGIGTVAVEKLPEAIVEANSIAVDAISGVTVTSDAIMRLQNKC